jgi:hypothetical protein
MESRIVSALDNGGFFVEPNQVLVDPRSGKSREIDVVAESDKPLMPHGDVFVSTQFVIEALNAPWPLIVMTPTPWSLTRMLDDYVIFERTALPLSAQEHLDLFTTRQLDKAVLYSQYCGLSRKKSDGRTPGELMASHPEDAYSTLLKLSDYLQHATEDFRATQWQDTCWRIRVWQPILVVAGDILALSLDSTGALSLSPLPSAYLLFNTHWADKPVSVPVLIARETELLPLMHGIVAQDAMLHAELKTLRKTEQSGGGV